jgi:hypothetical protein
MQFEQVVVLVRTLEQHKRIISETIAAGTLHSAVAAAATQVVTQQWGEFTRIVGPLPAALNLTQPFGDAARSSLLDVMLTPPVAPNSPAVQHALCIAVATNPNVLMVPVFDILHTVAVTLVLDVVHSNTCDRPQGGCTTATCRMHRTLVGVASGTVAVGAVLDAADGAARARVCSAAMLRSTTTLPPLNLQSVYLPIFGAHAMLTGTATTAFSPNRSLHVLLRTLVMDVLTHVLPVRTATSCMSVLDELAAIAWTHVHAAPHDNIVHLIFYDQCAAPAEDSPGIAVQDLWQRVADAHAVHDAARPTQPAVAALRLMRTTLQQHAKRTVFNDLRPMQSAVAHITPSNWIGAAMLDVLGTFQTSTTLSDTVGVAVFGAANARAPAIAGRHAGPAAPVALPTVSVVDALFGKCRSGDDGDDGDDSDDGDDGSDSDGSDTAVPGAVDTIVQLLLHAHRVGVPQASHRRTANRHLATLAGAMDAVVAFTRLVGTITADSPPAAFRPHRLSGILMKNLGVDAALDIAGIGTVFDVARHDAILTKLLHRIGQRAREGRAPGDALTATTMDAAVADTLLTGGRTPAALHAALWDGLATNTVMACVHRVATAMHAVGGISLSPDWDAMECVYEHCSRLSVSMISAAWHLRAAACTPADVAATFVACAVPGPIVVPRTGLQPCAAGTTSAAVADVIAEMSIADHAVTASAAVLPVLPVLPVPPVSVAPPPTCLHCTAVTDVLPAIAALCNQITTLVPAAMLHDVGSILEDTIAMTHPAAPWEVNAGVAPPEPAIGVHVVLSAAVAARHMLARIVHNGQDATPGACGGLSPLRVETIVMALDSMQVLASPDDARVVAADVLAMAQSVQQTMPALLGRMTGSIGCHMVSFIILLKSLARVATGTASAASVAAAGLKTMVLQTIDRSRGDVGFDQPAVSAVRLCSSQWFGAALAAGTLAVPLAALPPFLRDAPAAAPVRDWHDNFNVPPQDTAAPARTTLFPLHLGSVEVRCGLLGRRVAAIVDPLQALVLGMFNDRNEATVAQAAAAMHVAEAVAADALVSLADPVAPLVRTLQTVCVACRSTQADWRHAPPLVCLADPSAGRVDAQTVFALVLTAPTVPLPRKVVFPTTYARCVHGGGIVATCTTVETACAPAAVVSFGCTRLVVQSAVALVVKHHLVVGSPATTTVEVVRLVRQRLGEAAQRLGVAASACPFENIPSSHIVSVLKRNASSGVLQHEKNSWFRLQ